MLRGFRSTRETAALLRCAEKQLLNAIARGDLPAPAKRFGDQYAWSPRDVERAALVLATLRHPGRPRKQGVVV